MNFIDKLLRNYEKSSFVIRYKARFLLYLTMTLLLFCPVVIIYSLYIQLHDPVLNYSANWPVITLEVTGYIAILGISVLLVRGHFFASAHLTLSILTATIWAVMFIDCSNLISRLDTIAIMFGVFSAMPIFITRNKLLVFVYAGINITILYIYMFYTRGIFTMPGGSFPDFLADNTISFLFIAIVSYNILSINNRALEQYEISNTALIKSNDELQSAMEELTATNEEFEAQNEELVRSEEALRESLSEKTILIKEIHHRVKNNMQVISSLLGMQADTMKESSASQALKSAIGRIHSMASIHERVYSTENFSRIDIAAYIDELSRDLMLIHSGKKTPVHINSRMKPVFISLDKAIPCSLLINELLTNSIKHGNSGSGPCSIDASIEESDGWITLVIADNGPGMDPELFEAEQKTSMGMQIIDALAKQISATVTLDVKQGTRFTIRMPSGD